MIALISITAIQLIIDIIMYQQMKQQKKSIDIKIQRYRQEQLELIHQHQEWIRSVTKASSLQMLRSNELEGPKELLQEETRIPII